MNKTCLFFRITPFWLIMSTWLTNGTHTCTHAHTPQRDLAWRQRVADAWFWWSGLVWSDAQYSQSVSNLIWSGERGGPFTVRRWPRCSLPVASALISATALQPPLMCLCLCLCLCLCFGPTVRRYVTITLPSVLVHYCIFPGLNSLQHCTVQ